MKIETLELLACPLCQAKLFYDKKNQNLTCKFDKLVFPIKNGIPILLESEAKPLPQQKL